MKSTDDIKTIFEMLSYSTTRIDCILYNGSSSTGTGFFHLFE